jgi:hypothetical protein
MNVSPRSNSIMRAAVFHGRERITIEPVAIPEVAAGELLVRISRTVEAVDAYAFAIGAGPKPVTTFGKGRWTVYRCQGYLLYP